MTNLKKAFIPFILLLIGGNIVFNSIHKILHSHLLSHLPSHLLSTTDRSQDFPQKPYVLHVCPYENDYHKTYQNKYLGDSGVDVIIPHNVMINPYSYERIEYKTQFVVTDSNNYYKSYSYFLFARSSMQLYPLIFVNGVGIIDAGFRGNLSSLVYNPNNYSIKLYAGQKVIQICANDLSQMSVIISCNVSSHGYRGHKSFGSTSIGENLHIY